MSLEGVLALEERLGICFKDRSLLLRALTHRSYLNENPGEGLVDNERLEFLGDAVLDFVVGAYLYNRFPELREGELTMLRAALVRTRTLAEFARRLELGAALRLGLGEADGGGRERAANLCAAFEAVVGALFLDQGMGTIESWMQQFVEPALDEIIAAEAHRDAKSEFQIWAQARYNITPRYKVLSAVGPDHDKTFTVAVQVDSDTWGVGEGSSKQAAAQQAAAAALDRVDRLGVDPADDTQMDLPAI